MPRALVLVACWLSVLGVLASTACEKRVPAAASDAGSTRAEDEVILLGEVATLTGIEATMGISMQRGIQMALDEVNATGGVKLANGAQRKLDVRVYDGQAKPEEAASAVTRLLTQDKVKLVLGEISSGSSLAMGAKVQAAQIPMITPSSTNVRVTEVGDYVFRMCFIDPFQGKVMARFAHDNLKLKRVAVLKDNKMDYSIGLAEVFSKEWLALGNTITVEEAYSRADTDFGGQLTAIKATKPEAIYLPGGYTDVGVIARQARELGIDVPLLGGDGWESEKLFELGGNALEGSYYSNHYSSQDPSPRVQGFIASYRAKYSGAMPDAFAALGYDAANVAIAAIGRARDLSGPALRDEIAKTKDHPGVTGTITLDEKRNARKPAVVLQVKGGKTEYVATVNPT